MMFLLKCPKCGNNMKYASKTQILGNKTKKCVYCGHSYKARTHIIKEL